MDVWLFPDSTNPISKPNFVWICRLQLKLLPFLWLFWPILAKIWLPWQRPLDPCNQKCLLWIGRPRKPPVISNRILVMSRRNAFKCIYSNFCPNIGCHGNAALSLCMGVSQMNSPMHKPYCKNKLCIDVSLTTEVMAVLCFFGLFCLLWIGGPRKPPVISNRILVMSRRNAFMCIYSNFCPKIGCHGNAPLFFVYGSVTDEFPDGTNPIENETLDGCVAYNWSYGHFLIFWPILAKIWSSWQRRLDPCNQKCLIWIGRPLKPYPRTKNVVNSCYTREDYVDWKVRDKFSITGIGFFPQFCNKYGKLFWEINLTPKGPTLRGNTYHEPSAMFLRSTVRPVEVSKNIKNIESYIDR